MRFKSKVKSYSASAVEIYARFDHRSLGLARIGLGLLLLHNLWRRIPGLGAFYSNEGILPNHTVLWRPTFEYMFSFFLAASRLEEARVMLLLCAVVSAAFTIGYKTRLSHVLSFACLVSVQTRQAFTMNGGDVALSVLSAWTMFLPMGARFSVDALRESLSARQEATIAELADRSAMRVSDTHPTASLAYFALLLQLAVIYHFNAVNKHGWTWRRGLAIHYVLYQERMVTWFGWWLRDHIGFRISRLLTFVTVGLEHAAPIMLLSPIGTRWLRRAAIALLPLMHLAFAAFLNVGQFSFNMIGFFPLLLSSEDWSWFAAHLGPGTDRARIVRLRQDAPLAFAFSRLLARLDAFERLHFAPGTRWEVEEATTGRRATGALALAECLAALPCGLPFAAFLKLPGVRTLGDGFIAVVARKEQAVARWLGLRRDRTLSAARVIRPSPARKWFRKRPLAAVRELAVAVLIYACTNQLLVQNFAIPQRFKPHQPKWVTQLIWYARLDQGWQMFSPDVPTGERHLYIDAVTFEGRHVDPFNEAASRVANLPLERIPPHLMQDQFWYDYEREIFGTEAYWRALKDWIFAYHRRTGRPQDRVISFEAKIIECDGPPPGETVATNIRTKVMFSGHE